MIDTSPVRIAFNKYQDFSVSQILNKKLNQTGRKRAFKDVGLREPQSSRVLKQEVNRNLLDRDLKQ